MKENKKNRYAEALNAIDCYRRIYLLLSEANSVTQLSPKINEFVKELGFTDYFYMRLENNESQFTWDQVLTSMPEEWIRIYREGVLHRFDQTIAYAKRNTQPILSSTLYGYFEAAPFDVELTDKNKEIVQLNRLFGFSDHYVITRKGIDTNGRAMLMLTSSRLDGSEFESVALSTSMKSSLLCKAIDSICTRKFRSSQLNTNMVTITGRPLYILRAMANEDLTITQLAKELCISPITAHQHVAAAKRALGVKTNIAAVVKGIKDGLINLN